MLYLVVVVLAALIWSPHYLWGVPVGSQLMDQGKFLLAGSIITLTTLVGFFGMYLLQTTLNQQRFDQVADFRLLLILSSQSVAIILIAIDTNFNLTAIVSCIFVLVGVLLSLRLYI
ncbi:hypothetical protein H0A36_25445 [Endozoicomonas sp. SM1973]|uniref:Uncharacterized protein n=1 Tax=Spartinivicinus marinus TaxID=2994442 RepID=A0A853IFQ2_9GAMM|nr:hypothetical protein [Spartinivicinus marinus]MCX4026841.1 hypothetical protein [Spartinivicinus marinus]NYZ69368.1 hypothetical protein [Spartinivicinus marinus]